MSLFYTKKFYLRDYQRTSRSAREVIPIVINAFKGGLRSVIDIGCGRGVWLEEFAQQGVGMIKGRDGSWVQDANPLIRNEEFEATDLSKPYTEQSTYDLAMTLEVAEHIDEENADTFVENLTKLSDSIMFSAAIKGQGGQHHVNERPLSYWIEKFRQRGFSVYDPIRPRVWDNSNVCWWYRQNIVVFCRDGSTMEPVWRDLHVTAPHIFDLAHPTGFVEKAALANLFSPEEYVGLWFARAKRKLLGAH